MSEQNEQQETFQDKAQPIRDGEGRSDGTSITSGEGGAKQAGGQPGLLGQRVAGKNREGEFVLLITGGIVTQLIRDAERQLGNARASVEWYQREEEEALQRVRELRQLLASIQPVGPSEEAGE